MSSKTIFRSCGSSVRTLINRHIRPTVTTTIKTEPVANIYNWHYLLPNTSVPQPVNFGYGFGRNIAGESLLEEAASGRRTFAAAKRNVVDESIDDELDDDNDDEIEYEVSDEDDEDYEDDEDDHLVSDDD